MTKCWRLLGLLGAAAVGCGRDKTGAADATAVETAVETCVDQPAALFTPIAATSPCVAAPGTTLFGPARPLGFGYPDGETTLPPATAYLTFDDGPSDWTGEILDILAAENVRATFFVNAKNLKGPMGLAGTYTDAAGKTAIYRDVLARTVADGHVLGNHTVDHLDLASLTAAAAAAELDDNERLVDEALVAAGAAPRPLTLIRPPFGSPWYHHAPLPADPAGATADCGRLVANRGLDVMWTIDSSDSQEWAQGESYTRKLGGVTIAADAPPFADKVARIDATVLGDPAIARRGGAIILLHDTHNATRDALRAVIDGLRAAGYAFATIEDLAQARWHRPSVELTPGPAQFDACVPERDWGCDGGDDPLAICGRLWRAYTDAGGAATLGAATSAAAWSPTSGATTQSFARGVLALHPERATPCSAVVVPTP